MSRAKAWQAKWDAGGVEMPSVVFLLFLLLNFGPPFYWGFVGAGILAPLLWSVGMAMFAIGTDWRAPGRGVLGSALLGLCFATLANVSIYFIGRGFGTPARPLLTVTGFTQALLLSALIAGAAPLWRRMQNRSLVATRSARKPSPAPEVEAVFEKLDRLMTDEQAQVDGLPEPFRSEVISGASCDEIAGAVGEFGRNPRNPIPVNGPLGEVIYLSNLRTATSQQIMFHRLGSILKVDVYEIVSFDGAMWDVLFFDLYHPRKSQRAPKGYRIAAGGERERFLLGANEIVASFPTRLPEAISNTTERWLGGRMRPRQVREAIERINFKRPPEHQAKVDALVGTPSERPAANFREADRTMAIALMDPDDCWRDVCKLRGYRAPGPVATCEMAFARAAIIRDAITRCQSKAIAAEMLAGVDRFLVEAFASEDSPETLEHYKHERLSVVAPRAIRHYEENVFPLTQLADAFAHRLSVPGWPAAEIAPLFEEVAAEAERLMKISSLLTKIGR